MLWHFVLTDPEGDSATLTATFDTDGDLTTVEITETAASEPREGQGALHFYVITGPATLLDATTDVAGGNLVLSHICNEVVLEGSILVHKVDADTEALVGGASFELGDGTPLTEDPAGVHCVDGLAFGDYLVHEASPPTNYHADPDSPKPFTVDSISTCDERVGDAPDLTFFNEQMLGSIVVHKTDADTDALLGGAVFTVDGVGTMTEYADGVHCIDGLPFGEYTVTETTPPTNYHPDAGGPQNHTVSSESTCDETRLAGAADLLFENEEMVGSVLVHKTDVDTDALVGGAVFTLKAADAPAEEAGATLTEYSDGVHCIDGLSFGDYVVTESQEPPGYLPADPDNQPFTVDTESTCDEARLAGEADLVFENEEEEAPTGSVTILKDLGDCEICETATPGRWFNFNQSPNGTPGTNFANDSLGSAPITLAGEEFASVDDVHEHAKPGSLLWHTLGLEMNVRWGGGTECDLASLVYDGAIEAFHGMTVGEILQAAKDFLNGVATHSFTEQQLHDVVAEINESDTGDGTLVCGETAGSVAGADFEFELWVASDYPNDPPGPEDSGSTDETGELTFTGLEIGTEYLLVEVGGPDPDLTCAIVSAEGVQLPVTFDEEAGTITFTLTENVLDLTINVTNECEEEEEEEEFSVDLIKVDQDENTLEGVAFSLTGEGYAASDTSNGDGEIRFEGLLAGQVYTLTETEGAEDCETAGPWTVTVAMDGTVSIVDAEDNALDVVDGAFVIVNLCEEEEDMGRLEIIKWFCPTEGEDVIFWAVLTEEPLASIQGEEDEMPSTEGCTLGAESEEALGVWFEIEGGDLEDPLLVQTEWENIIELDLTPGMYTVTEVSTGLSAEIEIVLDGDTVVTVFNFEDEGQEAEEEGRLKLLKFSCDNEGETTFAIVEGDGGLSNLSTLPGDCASPAPMDATFTLTSGGLTSVEFTLGDDGARLIPLDVGTYTLNEVEPNTATSPAFEISDGATTTVIVFNFEGEGVAPEEEEEEERQDTRGSQGGPGQGTLPNTAVLPEPAGSIPAALLALVMLTGLGAAGYAMQAEARRRR